MNKKWILFLGLVIFTAVLLPGEIIRAAPQNFKEPKANPYIDEDSGTVQRINFENGGFEVPDTFAGTGSQMDMKEVPGWYTIPVHAADYSNARAFYIELQRDGFSANTNGITMYAAEGTQWAELNATVEGMLYQVCKVMPGARLYYEFYHRGRTGVDQMNFYLYATDAIINTDNPKDEIRLPDPTSDDLQAEVITDNIGWQHITGIYDVADDEDYTIFAFQSVSATGGIGSGNYLDGIDFTLDSFLEINQSISASGSLDMPVAGSLASEYAQYALAGETITYTLSVTNSGEATSSRSVLTDILPEGIELLPDSVLIDGAAAGSRAFYDDSKRILTVNIGTDAGAYTAADNAANGGKLEEMQTVTVTFRAVVSAETADPGDLIENQAVVCYNDSGFEEYNYAVDSNGNVIKDAGGNPVIEDKENYSNLAGFIVKYSEVSGTLWVDKNNNGLLETGERRISDAEVMLTDSAGNIQNDVNGEPLKVKSDGIGKYSFLGVPSGVYEVRYTHPGYQTTAGTGTTFLHNQGLPDPEDEYGSYVPGQIVSALGGNEYEVLIRNQNVGILPVITIEKSGIVSGSGVEEKGTAEGPVSITETNILTYILRVQNHAGDTADITEMLVIEDNIPEGLVIDQGGIQILQSGQQVTAGVTVSGQHIKIELDSVSADTVIECRIPVSLSLDSLEAADYINTAALTIAERGEKKESNPVYHHSDDMAVDFSIVKNVNKAVDQPEQFVFQIQYRRRDSDLVEKQNYGVVKIENGTTGKIDFSDMPPGYYEITEVKSNWRYTLENSQESEVLILGSINRSDSASFLNKKETFEWVSGKGHIINLMENQ